jgi:hypothetical protein
MSASQIESAVSPGAPERVEPVMALFRGHPTRDSPPSPARVANDASPLAHAARAYKPVALYEAKAGGGRYPFTTMSTRNYTNGTHNDAKDGANPPDAATGQIPPACMATWTFTDGIDGLDQDGRGKPGGSFGGQYFLFPTFGLAIRLRSGITIEWSGNPPSPDQTCCLHNSSTICLPAGVDVHSFFHTVHKHLVDETRLWRVRSLLLSGVGLAPQVEGCPNDPKSVQVMATQDGQVINGHGVLVEHGARLLMRQPLETGYGHARHGTGVFLGTTLSAGGQRCAKTVFDSDHASRNRPPTRVTLVPLDEVHDKLALLSPHDEKALLGYRANNTLPALLGHGGLSRHRKFFSRAGIYWEVNKALIGDHLASTPEPLWQSAPGASNGAAASKGQRKKWAKRRAQRADDIQAVLERAHLRLKTEVDMWQAVRRGCEAAVCMNSSMDSYMSI